MKDVKVIIGANFGDETKGMMTHFFAKNKDSCLNVLFNGGAQRGHTVNGHVFHSFGAATFCGADTYYAEKFYINPIEACLEFAELKKRKVSPKLFVDENCLVTLPYDIFINRELEEKRNQSRHGSCGMGVFETRLRSEEYPIYVKDFNDLVSLYKKIKKITKEYVPARRKTLGLEVTLVPDWVLDNFFKAINYFLTFAEITSGQTIYDNYDHILFEGSQGLLLSEDNMEYFPHLTPSFTGSQNIAPFINSLPEGISVEVCYVSRSYLTRHGAGRLDNECKKEDINPDIVDKTNLPNPFQGTLRFGYLDISALQKRVEKDFSLYTRPVMFSGAFNHLNYTNDLLICGKNTYSPLPTFFDKTYSFNYEFK